MVKNVHGEACCGRCLEGPQDALLMETGIWKRQADYASGCLREFVWVALL